MITALTLGGRQKIEASRSHTCNVAGDADKDRSMEKPRNEDNKERTLHDQGSLNK